MFPDPLQGQAFRFPKMTKEIEQDKTEWKGEKETEERKHQKWKTTTTKRGHPGPLRLKDKDLPTCTNRTSSNTAYESTRSKKKPKKNHYYVLRRQRCCQRERKRQTTSQPSPFFFSSCCRLSTILLFSLFFSAEPACAYPQFLSRTAPFAPPLRPERPVWMTRNASQPNKKTKKATFSCVFGIRGCPHSWLPIIVSAVLSILFFVIFFLQFFRMPCVNNACVHVRLNCLTVDGKISILLCPNRTKS